VSIVRLLQGFYFISAFAVLAGCDDGASGGLPSFSGMVPLTPTSQAAAKHASRALLYVADYLNGIVLIYRESGKNRAPIGQITAGISYPNSIAVDASGNLYVVNDPQNVQVYAPGTRTPKETLSPDVYADSVTVGADGTVYVGSDCSACTDKIDVFTGGALTPSYVITDPDVAIVYGMALDAANNLYVVHSDPNENSRISVFPPGSHGPGTDLGLRFSAAEDVAFDAAGNMVVVDALANEVYVYAPNSKTPKFQFSTPPRPWALAFNAAETKLYINQNRDTPQVDVFSYPRGKLIETIPLIPGGDASGVATSPATPK
jgi:DNA-binding beta-propeller fold protein YncE